MEPTVKKSKRNRTSSPHDQIASPGRRQVTPQAYTELESGKIDDSEDSSLSDTPDTLPVNDGLFTASDAPSTHKSGANVILPIPFMKERILRTALDVSPKDRHREMRVYFDKKGKLRKEYAFLNGEVRDAREKSKAAKQQGFDPVGNAPNTIVLEATNQDLQHEGKTVDGNSHTIVMSSKRQPCQQCRRKKRRCERLAAADSNALTCSWCVHEGKSCSLSTRHNIQEVKDIPSAIADTHVKLQQAHNSSARNPAVLDDISQTQRRTRSLNPQSSGRSTRTAILANHSSEEHAAVETADETTAVQSQPPSEITVWTKGQEGDRQDAVSAVRDTLQREIARAQKPCGICDQSPCCCGPIQRPTEEIMCNDDRCFKKWFSSGFLEDRMGIQLSDAENFRADYGFWHCPMCAYKKANEDPRRRNVVAATWTRPKHGSEILDDEDIRHSLNRLWALMSQYIGIATKSSTMRMQPLLHIPCVRGELPDECYHQLIYVLRRIMKVGQGRSVKNAIVDAELQDLEPSTWIKAVLVFLFSEFVFEPGSPYDDDRIWRKTLVHSFQSDLVDAWVQDNRLRTMTETEGTDQYQKRRKEQCDRHIRLLNPAMMPLIGGIGGNEGIHRIHKIMADIAWDLKAKFKAYTGEYEPILPGIGDRFDPELHVSDDSLDEFEDLSDRRLLLTTLVGVKFRLPGKAWRICAKAKVRLLPKLDLAFATNATVLQVPSGSSSRQSKSRKRPFDDVTRS